jgi:gamma-glutamyltranspeptidase/glutathione hydrolase
VNLPASVAAGHPATAAVGRDLLADGGSAADAVAGMVLAGCAAETIFSGLGGGGFATVYSADTRTVTCLDFFVAVPGLDGTVAGPARPIEVAFGGVAVPYEVGGPTVAVPGTPAGVAALHDRFGRLPWDRIVGPAEDLARQGVRFPAEHAALLPDIAAAMVLGDGIAAYSDPGTGLLLAAGQRLFHAGLADTLATYRRDGPAALMAGDWAERLVAAVRADGGALSVADLAAYRPRDLEPAAVPLGEGRVRARSNDLDSLVGTVAALDTAAVLAGEPGRSLALVRALRQPARRSETTSVAAVDADGNACAVTHSLGLGSGIWTGGVHANSMLGEGELVRGELAPGERMGSMMVPLVVTGADDELLLVAGAAGGSRIRPALLQILVGILLEGRTMPEAVAAPRLSATPEAVHLEPGFPATVPTAIEAADQLVVHWEAPRPYFGGVAGVGPGGPAADPRRGGSALML